MKIDPPDKDDSARLIDAVYASQFPSHVLIAAYLIRAGFTRSSWEFGHMAQKMGIDEFQRSAITYAINDIDEQRIALENIPKLTIEVPSYRKKLLAKKVPTKVIETTDPCGAL